MWRFSVSVTNAEPLLDLCGLICLRWHTVCECMVYQFLHPQLILQQPGTAGAKHQAVLVKGLACLPWLCVVGHCLNHEHCNASTYVRLINVICVSTLDLYAYILIAHAACRTPLSTERRAFVLRTGFPVALVATLPIRTAWPLALVSSPACRRFLFRLST